MNGSLRKVKLQTEVCVVGGGIAGMLTAIAAARKGARVVLVQDRPVLGGNASSEIRMWICGANGYNNRETGILAEIELEHIRKNPQNNYSVWDSILYDKVVSEKNIMLLLNCSCADAVMSQNRIRQISAWQLTTYTWYEIEAKEFVDCSGDGVLAPLTGAEYRVGREARDEYNESIAPLQADQKTMGMTCLLNARETERKIEFIPPSWAYVYETDEDLPKRPHDILTNQTFWWVELGGENDSIHDTESLRHELLKILYGVWDHIKNRGNHGADNWEIDWIGFLPGKRESRRYIGDHVLTQNDVEAGGIFSDVVAYGGWTMDDHNPAGVRYPDEPTIYHPAPSPYGIPFRSLYSRNIENLMFAGRNISATHSAMSSTRVMGTCGVIGEAVGIAAALCCRYGISPREVGQHHIKELQHLLLEDGCYLPPLKRAMPALTQKASVDLGQEEATILFNGMERPQDDVRNHVELPLGGSITFTLPAAEMVSELRLDFDYDFPRSTVSDDWRVRRFAMSRCHVFRNFQPLRVPATLVKRFVILGMDETGSQRTLFESEENYQALVRVPIHEKLISLTVRFDETWGCETVHLFACDIK